MSAANACTDVVFLKASDHVFQIVQMAINVSNANSLDNSILDTRLFSAEKDSLADGEQVSVIESHLI